MQKINKAKILILVVVITALLSCFAVSVVLAKYSSQFNGSYLGRTAEFNVTTAVDSNQQTNFAFTEQNPSAAYNFSVTSSSQVALSYNVVVTLPSALPADAVVAFSIANASNPTVNGNVYTFFDVGFFTSAGGTNNHTLTITVGNFDNSFSLDGVSIKVVATQSNAV